MTARAVIFGLLMGLLVSAASFFSSHIIQQADLVGSHIPIAVFGCLFLVLLVGSALFARTSRWAIRRSEVAVSGAIALAACGWPGTVPNMIMQLGMPAYWQINKPAWQSQKIFSYVPQGSPAFAEGHVVDWGHLSRELIHAPPGSMQGDIANALPKAALDAARSIIDDGGSYRQRPRLLKGVNQIVHDAMFRDEFPRAHWPARAKQLEADRLEIERKIRQIHRQIGVINSSMALPGDDGTAPPQLPVGHEEDSGTEELQDLEALAAYYDRQAHHHSQHITRSLLVAAFPQALRPAPRGQVVLPAGGRRDAYVIEKLALGVADRGTAAVTEVPWRAWRPALVTWAGLVLLIGLAGFALVWVVNPQWVQNEQLTYPIAGIASDFTNLFTDHKSTSLIRSAGALFWLGAIAIFLVHMVNYLHAWFPALPSVPLRFDFTALRRLMPFMSQAPGASFRVWQPTLFFTVIAIGYFLPRQISLSLALSGYTWIAFCGLMISQGVAVEFASMVFPIRFGAQLAFFLIILYLGRRYYIAVAASSLGLSSGESITKGAIWAARMAVIFAALASWLLYRAGLDWSIAVAFVLLVLMLSVVLTRISVETGLFYLYPGWSPTVVLVGVMGIKALGPTNFLLTAIAAGILIPGMRETLMAFVANGLEMTRRGNVSRGRVLAPMLVMLLVGFGVTVIASFVFTYGYGAASLQAGVAFKQPVGAFDDAAALVSELAAAGQLQESVGLSGLARWLHVQPNGTMLGWMAAGFIAVAVCSIGRLRLPWWPIHPILFLLWGIWPLLYFCFPFLLGWAIKTATLRIGGTDGFYKGKRLMLGFIAADLLAALAASLIGFVYYLVSGLRPPAFNVLGPG